MNSKKLLSYYLLGQHYKKDKNTEKENLFYALEAKAKKKYKNNPEKLKEVIAGLKRSILKK